MATLIENRKAKFNYEFKETFEAGLELSGHEVKSIRKGQMSLDGSYVSIRGGEAFLMGATITSFQPKNVPDGFDSERVKKLLLNKKQIAELAKAETTKGLTVIPFSVYNKGRVLKVGIAIARGKKQFDKREDIKKRETDREIRRSLKN